ncbi:mitochondrial carrier domain-containing protein [Hysterangium stoloniferum]|nr:mitochondrial carrier domain-containing protein [Hysterangium stoloniferum]
MKSRSVDDPGKQTISYISRELLAGGVAGSVAKTVVAPFDRVKILFQASNPQFQKYAGRWTGVFYATHDIYVQSGVRGLYQGHSATLIRIFPYAAIKFMAYSRFRRALMPTKSSETNFKRFLAGSLSGTTSVLFTYPLELIRVRLAYQTRTPSATARSSLQPHSLSQIISLIYHEGSPSSKSIAAEPHPTPVASPKQSRIFASFPLLKFYRGFSVTIYGMIPYAGTSFLAWDFLRAKIYGTTAKPTRIGNLVVGAISGVVGQTISYPFEVVRRRMQVGGLTRPDRWMGWRETVKSVWRQAGWRGFFVGLSIGYLKVIPMTAVSFAVWEEMKRILIIE